MHHPTIAAPSRGAYVIAPCDGVAAFDVTVNRGAFYEGGLLDEIVLLDGVLAHELGGLLVVLDGAGYRQELAS